MSLKGFELKVRFHKFYMTGCVDFGSGRIKRKIGTLGKVPNKHTRMDPELSL